MIERLVLELLSTLGGRLNVHETAVAAVYTSTWHRRP